MPKAKPPQIQKWLKEDQLVLLRGWAMDGMTQQDIAKRIGVSVTTIITWRAKYPEIAAALAETAEKVDRQVEQALLRRAMGYTYEETTTIVEQLPDGEKKYKSVKVTKHVPADSVAQVFWLKNRKSAEWRDRREMEIAAGMGSVQIIDDIDKPKKLGTVIDMKENTDEDS